MKLYEWQQQALTKWNNNNHRGICECPTGSGKTLFGIEAMKKFRKTTLVICPTIVIMHQWYNEILRHTNITKDKIGLYYGLIKEIRPITIAVINSIRKVDLSYFKMCILDEAHRYCSNVNLKPIINNDFKYRLGLTATLSRDDLKHLKLISYFAPVIYRYSQRKAISEGILNRFIITNIGVSLTSEELKDLSLINNGLYLRDVNLNECGGDYYKIINELAMKHKDKFLYNIQKDIIIEDINNAIKEGKEILTLRLYSLKELFREFDYDYKAVLQIKSDFSYKKLALIKMFNKRKEIIYKAHNKITECLGLILKHKNEKIIVFNEFNEVSDNIYNLVKNNTKINVGIIHSGIKKKERNGILDKFRTGEINVIIATKVLDEGLNVPDCGIGIIISASNVRRQTIQRIGRIIRKKDKPSLIYQLYIRNSVDERNIIKRTSYIKDSVNKIEWE